MNPNDNANDIETALDTFERHWQYYRQIRPTLAEIIELVHDHPEIFNARPGDSCLARACEKLHQVVAAWRKDNP